MLCFEINVEYVSVDGSLTLVTGHRGGVGQVRRASAIATPF